MPEITNEPDAARDTGEAELTQNDDHGSAKEQALEALFPPKWEWLRHEDATREFAAQVAGATRRTEARIVSGLPAILYIGHDRSNPSSQK